MKFLVLFLLAMPFAMADEPGGDDDMIQAGGAEQTQQVWLVGAKQTVSEETHDVQTVTVKNDAGEDTAIAVIATDKKTGHKSYIGLGENTDEAVVRATLAIRLTFPELVGLRGGITVYDLVEMGFDVGVGVFFNDAGLYLNVYPLANMKKWYSNFYAGVRYQSESIWAIFGTMTGNRAEAVLGYRFDTKKGRIFWMFEAGMGQQVGTMKTTSIWAGNGESNDDLRAPVVTIGIGFNISSKHKRH